MTVSCCMLGHLAHSTAESNVCSLSDDCVCFLSVALIHTLASIKTLYCCCLQCSLIYARGLNFSSQSLIFIPHCRDCSLSEALPISWKEETNESPNQWYPWGNWVYTLGWRTGWRSLLTGVEDQFAVRMCWKTCAMRRSFWHSWPGIAGDFCTTAKPCGLLGDWWPVPVLTLPTRPFLLPLVADGKSSL